MPQTYYSLITNTGLLAEAAASAPGGSPTNLTHLAVGDGNGANYEPDGAQTSLVNELYRTELTHVVIDENNPSQLIIEGVISETVGPFYIREVGIFDSNGQLFAIGKYPETFKSAMASGSGKRLYIRMILGFANSPSVNLVISEDINNDPNFSSNVLSAISGLNAGLEEKLDKAANLSDLTDAESARNNLGLGAAAIAGSASESSEGIAQIATQLEVDAKTNQSKFVTPKTLANSSQLSQASNKTSALSVEKLFSNRSSREVMAVIMKDGNIKVLGRGTNYANTDPNGNHYFQPELLAVDPDNPPTSKFVQVTTSTYSGYALDADGKVYSWGYNGHGQLGHGDTVARKYAQRIGYFVNSNIQIAEIITCNEIAHNDVSAVFFRATNGFVYGCGDNHEGLLGDGTTIARYTPIRIGTLTNVVQVVYTGGNAGTAYFRTDNGAGVKELYVTGWNAYGQLGLGHNSNAIIPTKINGYSNVTHVAACGGVDSSGSATYGSAIFIDSGKIYTTGYNGYGQLGQGNTTNLNTWTRVGSYTDIIDAGMVGTPYTTTYIIDSSGNILLCGYNGYGQLGRGNTVHVSVFVSPLGGDLGFQGNIKKVLLAGDKEPTDIIILDNNGQVYGAGYGYYGTLSHGDFANYNHTVFKKGINSKISYETRKCIDVGCVGYYYFYSVCLLYDDGTLRIAGQDSYGLHGTNPSVLTKKIYSDINF